jgi:hypothetical protein
MYFDGTVLTLIPISCPFVLSFWIKLLLASSKDWSILNTSTKSNYSFIYFIINLVLIQVFPKKIGLPGKFYL